MNDNTEVVETTVVPADVQTADPVTDNINSQETNFKAQLEQVKADMQKLSQQFDQLKVRGTKLEGALESLQILKQSLQSK